MATATPKVHGRPGTHARKLAFGFYGKALGVATGALAVLALLWWMGKPFFGVLAAFVGALIAHYLYREGRKASIGYRTEKELLKVVRKVPGVTRIWCGLRPGNRGGDIDLAVAARGYLFVVEVKTGFGQVGYRDGGLYSGKRRIPGDPILQAQKAAERAAKHLKAPLAYPVVCVVQGRCDPFTVADVTVVNKKGLVDLLAGHANWHAA